MRKILLVVLFFCFTTQVAVAGNEFVIPFKTNVEHAWESIGIWDSVSVENPTPVSRIIQIHVNSYSQTGITFFYGCGGYTKLSPGNTIRCTIKPYTPTSGLIAWTTDGINDKRASGTILLETDQI